MIYKVLYIPGGAGFLPSTVCVLFFMNRIDEATKEDIG